MSETEFEILATKVLAGEATDQEKEHLRQLCANDSNLHEQFEDLELARKIVLEVGPLAQSMEAPPARIPEEQLTKLMQMVRAQANRRAAPAPRSAFSLWHMMSSWHVAARAAMALGALALVAWAALLAIQSHRQKPAGPLDAEIVAYLVGQQGNPHVYRRGQPLDSPGMPSLQASDELQLAANDEVHVLSKAGLVQIRGSRKVKAAALATDPASVKLGSTNTAPLMTAGTVAAATRAALFNPAHRLLGLDLFITRRDMSSIALYSPVGSTRNLTPLFLWKTDPGKTYNLTIMDEFDAKTPPWRLNGVTSPVDFSNMPDWKGRPLSKGGLYRVRLSETGNPLSASETTFRTLPQAAAFPVLAPSTSSDRIERAWQSLAATTPSLGDAMAELMSLPPAVASSDLALRLKLLAFGQLGLKDDYDAVAAKLAGAPGQQR